MFAKTIKHWRPARRERNREGDLIVALLFVGAALVATGIFALTDAYLGPTDTTLQHVPDTAYAYVHAHGPAARVMSPVEADEVAAYLAEDESGMLTWHTLVAWRPLRYPDAATIEALDEAKAHRIDERHYLIGDPSASRIATGRLIDDALVADALRRTRASSRMQGFVRPSAFIAEDAGVPYLRPFVAGIRVDGDLTKAFIQEIGDSQALDVDADYPLSGAIGFSEPFPTIDPITLLFGTIPSITDVGQLVSAEKALRAAMSGPYTVTINDPGTEKPTVTAVFPKANAETLVSAANNYAAALYPKKKTIPLPDGDIFTEIVLDATARQERVIRFGVSEQASVRIIPDPAGTGATIVSPSTGTIAEQSQNRPRCLGSASSASLIIKGRTVNQLSRRLPDTLPAFPLATTIEVGKQPDGSYVACVY